MVAPRKQFGCPPAMSKSSKYGKSSIKLPGGLFNCGHSRGGHQEEGGLLEKRACLQILMKGIKMIPFQFFTSYFVASTHSFTSQTRKFDRGLFLTISKSTNKLFQLKR